MCQPVTLSEHIVDLVNFLLPPAGRQAGAHRGHAGGLMRFQCRVSPGVVADEAAGLVRDGVKGADESVEALTDAGGVERFVIDGGG